MNRKTCIKRLQAHGYSVEPLGRNILAINADQGLSLRGSINAVHSYAFGYGLSSRLKIDRIEKQ